MTRDSVCRHLVHCAGHDLGSHSGCINPSNGNSAMAREKAVSTDVCGTEARSRLGYRLAVHRQRQRGRVGGVGKGASGSHSPHKWVESSQCNVDISPHRDFFFAIRCSGRWGHPPGPPVAPGTRPTGPRRASTIYLPPLLALQRQCVRQSPWEKCCSAARSSSAIGLLLGLIPYASLARALRGEAGSDAA